MDKVYGRNITQEEYFEIEDTVAKERGPDYITILDYWLDPDLFHSNDEALAAMDELSSCFNHEMTKTEEHGYKYKEDNHKRDVLRLKESMLCRQHQ